MDGFGDETHPNLIEQAATVVDLSLRRHSSNTQILKKFKRFSKFKQDALFYIHIHFLYCLLYYSISVSRYCENQRTNE